MGDEHKTGVVYAGSTGNDGGGLNRDLYAIVEKSLSMQLL
jgi:hypothetical protein